MKILYLTASPQFVEFEQAQDGELDEIEYPKLDLWPELKVVSDALFEARAEGFADIEVVPEVRRQDLQRYLSRRGFNVLHFSGHGDRQLTPAKKEVGSQQQAEDTQDAKDGKNRTQEGHQAALLFNHEFGYGEFVPNDWLKDQLADKDIDVVVLNCCWSQAVAECLKDVVGAVIGTTSPLLSDDAQRFAKAFYETLQSGATLGEARDAAQKVIGEDLYVFHPAGEDPIWRRVITPLDEGEADEEHVDLLSLADRFLKLREEGYWQHFGWDAFKIGLGLLFAWLGYTAIDGATQFAATADEGTFWGDLIIYLAGVNQEGSWLKYEPFAILTAFAAVPVSRFLLAPMVYWLAEPAANAITALSLYPEARIETELGKERLQKLSEWLKRFER